MWALAGELELDNDPPVPAHVTVLRDETMQAIAPRSGCVYVDATLGGGGHAEALLLAAPDTLVVGIDRDPAALEVAAARLAPFGKRVRFVRGGFADLRSLLVQAGVDRVHGILADLGISSPQLSDPTRGMSFRTEGPLDMRMDPDGAVTALDLIDSLDQDELANLLFKYGEERRSRRVARCIKLALADGRLSTTLDLRRAVVRAVGPARVGGVDPATKTFQALRIAVNGELDQVEALLRGAHGVLVAGGALAVISFHSLEDRLVKRAFQDRAHWSPQTKKPITPGSDEVQINPRSRSAKLRVALALEADCDDLSLHGGEELP